MGHSEGNKMAGNTEYKHVKPSFSWGGGLIPFNAHQLIIRLLTRGLKADRIHILTSDLIQ